MTDLMKKRFKASETSSVAENKTEKNRAACVEGPLQAQISSNGMNPPIKSKALFGDTFKLDRPSNIAPLPEDVESILGRLTTTTGVNMNELELLMGPILSTTQNMSQDILHLPPKDASRESVQHFLLYFFGILLGKNYYIFKNKKSTPEDSNSSCELVITKGPIEEGLMPRVGVDSNIMVEVMTSGEFLENRYWHDLTQYLKRMFNSRVFEFGYVVIACQSHFACIKITWAGEIFVPEMVCSMSRMTDVAFLKRFVQEVDVSALPLPPFYCRKGVTSIDKSVKLTDLISFNQGVMVYGAEEGYVVKVRKNLDPSLYHDSCTLEIELIPFHIWHTPIRTPTSLKPFPCLSLACFYLQGATVRLELCDNIMM